MSVIDLSKYKNKAKLTGRYQRQLDRLQGKGIATDSIEAAVTGAVQNLAAAKTAALVIYGEPQSGKTEMMICLTAKLLDEGHKFIVHLMTDSVDLLSQNLRRFKASKLAPAPRNITELPAASDKNPNELVIFCKKNARDLEKLIHRISGMGNVVVIDDEADYATPNSKVNQKAKSPINDLVGQLIQNGGFYIGVTATPARLDLNNTYQNKTETWVHFRPHEHYTGQDTFFPLDKNVPYRLTLLKQGGNPKEARDALVRFLVTAAYLNEYVNEEEQNYTMLVHTSGRKSDHEADRVTIEDAVHALTQSESTEFDQLVTQVHVTAQQLYPSADPERLTDYVVENASRAIPIVLNSKRDRKAAGENPAEPTSPFTVIIGGNIVSRGVTFPNLLSMFFTRDVKHQLQQDTYIQRARMFGARGPLLSYFELTIPSQLYADWHRCFVFHRLALETVRSSLGSPVWIGDKRVAVASSPSIDKAAVAFDKGEMSFGMFDFTDELDAIINAAPTSISTLKALKEKVGDTALPQFLIDYIEAVLKGGSEKLGIHTSRSIEKYGASADKAAIYRKKGFLGTSQLQKFPAAVHHVAILRNTEGKARIFYKNKARIQTLENISTKLAA